MAEPITPGPAPLPRSRFGGGNQSPGGSSKQVDALARRLGAIERLLQPYHPRTLGSVSENGSINQMEVLARNGGSSFIHPSHAFAFWLGGQANSRLFMGPGTVIYAELARQPDSSDEETPAYLAPVFPVFGGRELNSVDAAGLPPSVAVGGRSSGSLWLVCKKRQCGTLIPVGGEEKERVVLANRNAKPEVGNDETAIPIAKFDIQGQGGVRQLANVEPSLQSDWIQVFSCDDESSNDDSDEADSSSDEADSSDSGDPDPDSDESMSSDFDSSSDPDDHECCPNFRIEARITNPGCLPTDPGTCPPRFAGDPASTGQSVWATVTISGARIRCPDCHGALSASGHIAGVPLQAVNLGSTGSYTWGPLRICPTTACTTLGGEITVVGALKAGAPLDECEPIECTKSFTTVNQTPAFCGSECETTFIDTSDE